MENVRTTDYNRTTVGDDDGGGAEYKHPMLAVLLGSFCVITVFGNCLVVVAVAIKKYLRNPTGYLIVSLAFADLIVGTIVMPFNIVFEMSYHDWPFGTILFSQRLHESGPPAYLTTSHPAYARFKVFSGF